MKDSLIVRTSFLLSLFLAGFLIGTTAPAGPVATLRFHKGRSLRVEILHFSNGAFHVKNLKTNRSFSALDSDIDIIDFGPQPQIKRPDPLSKRSGDTATAPFHRAVQQRQFGRLLWRAYLAVNRLDDEQSVLAFEREIKDKLARGQLTPAKRRDYNLSLAAVAFALGDRPRGALLLRALQEQNPDDVEVKKFVRLLEAARKRLRREGPATGPSRNRIE